MDFKLVIEAPDLAAAINNLAAALAGRTVKEPPKEEPSVPVAPAPQYTIDQIMKAGAGLMDAGKIDELRKLISSFGVEAVTSLKPEQYGAFATELRGLGAKI